MAHAGMNGASDKNTQSAKCTVFLALHMLSLCIVIIFLFVAEYDTFMQGLCNYE